LIHPEEGDKFMHEIDARGLNCPAPVLQTKAALQVENHKEIRVIVDNAAAQQNVQRFLESEGYEIELGKLDDDYQIKGKRSRDDSCEPIPSTESHTQEKRIMVLCATDRLGYGDDDLGRKLMVNFIRTLSEMGKDLWRLVFVNNGVKLTIDESEVLKDLKAYEGSGLQILVCGTCLNHFNLLERKQVGETTNMLDIVTAMQLADQVINI
jgi:selenium metabolism protein YedF